LFEQFIFREHLTIQFDSPAIRTLDVSNIYLIIVSDQYTNLLCHDY